MDSRYTDEQYADNYPDGVEHHYWNVARNTVVYSTLVDPFNHAVLDVGCGRGIVVDYLRTRGVNCWGCEIGRPRPLTTAVAPYLLLATDAMDVDDGLASKVTQLLFLDVLEHLEDPHAVLAGCRRRFPVARRMTITVPARTELWTNYDVRFGHHRRYNLRDARELARCLSPRRVRTFYFFHALYPVILATAVLGIGRETTVRVPTGALTRKAHRLVANALRASDRVLPGWLPGSSICAVVDL
jgi:hypothetical protein